MMMLTIATDLHSEKLARLLADLLEAGLPHERLPARVDSIDPDRWQLDCGNNWRMHRKPGGLAITHRYDNTEELTALAAWLRVRYGFNVECSS